MRFGRRKTGAKVMTATATAEPESIEIDSELCRWCGLPIDQHARIDTGEGPEFKCDELESEFHLRAQERVRRWEEADPRDQWKHNGAPQDNEPPPHTEIPPEADRERNHEAAPPKVEIAVLPPLTLDEWRNRDLPEPDFIMGHWLTTTSRVLLSAATGLGKTNFGLALGMRAAANMGFLHWQARRTARVLYIDGEMSRQLLRQRVLDEERRVGITPEFFFALSHEDIEGFKPLNTIEGQMWMNALIEKLGGVDLVIADNIMCLTVGDTRVPNHGSRLFRGCFLLPSARSGRFGSTTLATMKAALMATKPVSGRSTPLRTSTR
jgi:hypothetical protein